MGGNTHRRCKPACVQIWTTGCVFWIAGSVAFLAIWWFAVLPRKPGTELYMLFSPLAGLVLVTIALVLRVMFLAIAKKCAPCCHRCHRGCVYVFCCGCCCETVDEDGNVIELDEE
eukprot:TRINITY_DN16066_c0_g1_i1.p1 TRINITY_DN16066_c0_g1~~TRINITY_DN16066_c0_g1_i1.p1  ORF type:complete len:115 (-),score=7.60 TRINITY_DN16066_c0_g1_i1:136-480(-)